MRRLLFTLTFALSAFIGWSQCDASFYIAGGNNTYDTLQIINTSTSSNNGVWNWSMPGASPSSATTYDTTSVVEFLYGNSGTYWVCVVMYDSNWSCTDSFCDSITIGGSSSTLSVTLYDSAAACGACDGQIYAAASGGTSPYTYSWSNSSTAVQATNLCPGTYSVTVTDNNGATATSSVVLGSVGSLYPIVNPDSVALCPGDTLQLTGNINATGNMSWSWSTGAATQSINVTSAGIYTVTVTDGNGCTGTASATVLAGGLNVSMSSTNETCVACCDGTATASATGGNGSYTYSWSNSASTASISSLCAGAYTVTVTDGNGCTGTGSSTILAYTCSNINGIVTQGPPAKVYLITESSGSLSAVDSTLVDSIGFYNFSGVCNGTYYTKAALLPAHAGYSTTIPTYYDTAALWSNATAIIVSNNNVSSVNINMLSGTNSGGPGFVGGLISQGANRAEGDPIVGAQVVLYDEDGDVSAFTKSDANGEYELSNLAYGTYTIHVDILNKTSYPHTITIDADNEDVLERNFTVHSDMIKPSAPVGITGLDQAGFELFPNPVDDVLTIRKGEAQLETLTLYNIAGEQVMTVTVSNQDLVHLNVSELAQGPYILEMSGPEFTHHQSIIVK